VTKCSAAAEAGNRHSGIFGRAQLALLETLKKCRIGGAGGDRLVA